MTELSPGDCASRISDALDDVFAATRRIGSAVEVIWRARAGVVSVRELAALQPTVFAAIDSRPHFTGAGFLADPGALTDSDRYLEWWQRDGRGGHTRLVVDLDPRHPDGYDYVTMEWYVSAKAGRPYVRGPYLDYPGADRFVLTFASPVTVEGRFIGASGVDVLVSAFEPVLFDHVRREHATLALVDRDDRVIVSNSPDAAPSERLRTPSVVRSTAVGSAGVGWRLCTLEPR